MPTEWYFGDDETLDGLFRPGLPQCYHCGATAPEGVPDSYARCGVCDYHLHTCPNCMFYNGVGCMILEPHVWSDGTIIGKFCPSFVWRQNIKPSN
jgi:hypothetical protein